MTGYMAEMRKLVGHRTIIQCGASAICVDAAGRMLPGRRSDSHMPGFAGDPPRGRGFHREVREIGF